MTDELMKNPVYADRLEAYAEVDDTFYTRTMDAKQRTIEREAQVQAEKLRIKRERERVSKNQRNRSPDEFTSAVGRASRDRRLLTSAHHMIQFLWPVQIRTNNGFQLNKSFEKREEVARLDIMSFGTILKKQCRGLGQRI